MQGADGDAIVFSSDWAPQDWERHRSWHDAWAWIGGSATEGDTVEVLPIKLGIRVDSYAPALDSDE